MIEQIFSLLDSSRFLISDIKPSQWNEKHRVMTSDVSPFPGPFSYNVSPYLKEVVDCLSPGHPAKIIAVMKGAQVGFSTGVIEAGIGWIISENPGNILFLTGHSDLAEEAMNGKIDQMIDSCGLRTLIRPSVLRKKNMRTGDTNKSKEFPGGSLIAGGASNHKLLRQRSVRYGFIDDFEGAKGRSKESGSTTEMIEQRFAAYADKMKLFYISTPELKQTSNIEPAFLLGDQRRWHIPCPCCGEYIVLQWNVPMEDDTNKIAGITWTLDEKNRLISDTVGYICQKCGGFFNDSTKYELNLLGEWRPTAEPSKVGYYSYHLSSLYAPPGAYDWEHYVRQYLNANPINGKQKEDKQQTFVNLCLGETFEPSGEAPKANDLQKYLRAYQIGLIPEKVSIKDGNGKIVLITCACDLNGIEDDARLDYEIVGWSETGSSYSITHGSIGTFIPRENTRKHKEDRARWTYEHHRPNSVWPEFDKVIDEIYLTDTGRKMKILMTGVDTGHYTTLAYSFIDRRNSRFICALKGDKENKYRRFGVDTPKFKKAKERSNMYLVDVNLIKDELANLMRLKWDEGNDDSQPSGFMNYPQSSGGKYLFKNYFSHFEGEHRIIESKEGEGIAAKWEKKSASSQNHFWDVRVYNMALREIVVSMVCTELKIKNYSWNDYVDVLLGRFGKK
jgi:phage terminase large subunit GpA-like protein